MNWDLNPVTSIMPLPGHKKKIAAHSSVATTGYRKENPRYFRFTAAAKFVKIISHG